MVKFMVMVSENGKTKGLGEQTFTIAPRTGEYVTIDDEKGEAQNYKVIAVMHPLEPAFTAGDLILKHTGTDLDFRMGGYTA